MAIEDLQGWSSGSLDRVGAGLEAPSESGAGEEWPEGCWLHDQRKGAGGGGLIHRGWLMVKMVYLIR